MATGRYPWGADYPTLLPKPGDWAWVLDESGTRPYALIFHCPCNGKTAMCANYNHFITIMPHTPSDHSWNWNGDWEQPTLRPSILSKSGCQWHGYMVRGVLRAEAPDEADWKGGMS